MRERLTVAVRAQDSLSAAGIVQYLGGRPDLELVPAERTGDASVVVVVEACLNAAAMVRLTALSRSPGQRFVLVVDRLADAHLLTAVSLGVVAVLWRAEATAQGLYDVLLAAGRGGSHLPRAVQAQLLQDVLDLQRRVLAPLGLGLSGLDSREVSVLRLMAEGLTTAQIADRMRYSERTVKGILNGLMTRLDLRTRSQAVAHAMRAGIL